MISFVGSEGQRGYCAAIVTATAPSTAYKTIRAVGIRIRSFIRLRAVREGANAVLPK